MYRTGDPEFQFLIIARSGREKTDLREIKPRNGSREGEGHVARLSARWIDGVYISGAVNRE